VNRQQVLTFDLEELRLIKVGIRHLLKLVDGGPQTTYEDLLKDIQFRINQAINHLGESA